MPPIERKETSNPTKDLLIINNCISNLEHISKQEIQEMVKEKMEKWKQENTPPPTTTISLPPTPPPTSTTIPTSLL
eukprot:3933613-Ditylum_brightwellii.AAC.1